ncbi:Late embryogenesis abundant protein group 2 [Zea mays]|uniref:Late embryogenesis abundant protein group 2 n=1 Tax=Zea mays TaxID=4577 RepID=A0A1D6LBI0_MAIZE|nr:Late embryogenesis abundant protein group 2 [Zea mays]
MSSSAENDPTVTVTERGGKDKHEDGGDKEQGGGGFIDKVKDFIHDIGEKIEEVVGFGKPTADVCGIHIPHISLHRADLVVDVLIKNPNPVPIPLVDIDYLIDSDGRKLVSGLIPDAGTIHAHGQETVKIPVSLDVPIIGRVKIPIQKDGEIPIPYKPDVDVEKIKFHHFSFEETTATLHLKLENKNDFDLGLNLLEYEMWLGDDSIASAELTQTAKIEKQGITRMQVPFSFRPKDFGSAVWDMIRGRGTGYTIKGKIDVDTPFGNMKLPISKEGGTTRLKKEEEEDDDDDN